MALPPEITNQQLPDQTTGVVASFTAEQYNTLKNSHIALLNFVRRVFDNNEILKEANLPESELSPEQFEKNDDTGYIELINYNLIGTGGGTTTPLAKSVQTISNIGQSGFTNSWTAVPNAVSYTWQIATNAAFTTGLQTVYTGNDLTKSVTGLTASTPYFSRVISNPGSGYSASTSDNATATTLASGGGGNTLTRITAPAVTAPSLTFTTTDSKTVATQSAQNVVQKHREGFTTGVKDISYRATYGGIGVAFEEKAKGYEAQPYLLMSYNSGNGKLEAFIKNVGSTTVVQDYFPGAPILLGFDYRLATKDILFLYSTDNGATYTQGTGSPVVVPDGMTILLRVNRDTVNSGEFISEQFQLGMTLDQNVT